MSNYDEYLEYLKSQSKATDAVLQYEEIKFNSKKEALLAELSNTAKKKERALFSEQQALLAKLSDVTKEKEKLLKEQNDPIFIDQRDGQKYKVVKIGKQVWMAENLNYKCDGSKCYDNDPANAKIYGRLYNWETKNKACPLGWHLPSVYEYEDLFCFVDVNERSMTYPEYRGAYHKTAGKYLKAKSGWDSNSKAYDTYGFSALPGGEGKNLGNYGITFQEIGSYGKWWCQDNSCIKMGNLEEVSVNTPDYDFLFSIRCVQNDEDFFTDQRDGKVYRTLKIGKQIWMAENLNYECTESKCYDNDPANAELYGRLYDWKTAMEVCPEGWHLPSNEEWDVLLHYVDGTKGTVSPYKSESAGWKLKATAGWNDYNGKSGNGTDEFGFFALPGGTGFSDGSFKNAGNYGAWWSASEVSSNMAYRRYMGYSNGNVICDNDGKIGFLSVRCIKDDEDD